MARKKFLFSFLFEYKFKCYQDIVNWSNIPILLYFELVCLFDVLFIEFLRIRENRDILV